MRSFWSSTPMLRLAFALIAGISFEIAIDGIFHFSPQIILVPTLLLLLSGAFIIAAANIKNVTLTYRLRILNGIALHTLIIAFGFLLTWFYTQKNYPTNFAHFLTGKNVLVVKITEPPVLRDKTVMVNTEVMEVNNATGHFATTGNIQLSFLKDSICQTLSYGDELLIRSRIDTTDGPKNPYEFNFKTYQAFHNIYNKSFVTSSDWAFVARNQGNGLLAAIYKLRDNFLKVLARYVTNKNDFGVASAIMLGYRDYINADIMRAYASSGAVHVLSVSGLHVSIMFFMLNFLLGWMDKRGRKMVFAKAGIIILFIWFYACLTGLSPPVLRSAMMFTLIQLGQVLLRNINTYNIVAASAVLLMLFNPFVITDVGFQLSYIAVFGIIYLQPKIAAIFSVTEVDPPVFKTHGNWLYKLFLLFRYDLKWLSLKMLDLCWQLMAASLAAQIATLPLCFMYFYQFPNLFLLSNMVVIPLGNLLLFAGTGLFSVSHIPYLNDLAGWLFNFILVWLDRFIFWIDSLPFALTNAICVSAIEMVLLYLLIFLLCWLTEQRRNRVVISALAIILLLCSISSFKKFEQHGQKEIVVYSVPKQKALAFISDRTIYYDIDTALYDNQSNMQFHIYHHWWQSGISNQLSLTDSIILKPGLVSMGLRQGKLILFEGKKVLLLDSLATADIYGTRIKLKADLVILSGAPKVSIPILKRSIDFDEVVFDSSTKTSSRKRWKKDCSELNINYWDVNTDGAYIWNLRNDMP